MKRDEDRVFEFERFRLDASKRLFFDADEPVPLMPKAFDILCYIVERAGSVVEKNDLMDAIWPDTAVEENNLTQNISALRKVLGEKHRENRFIATVPGRGYKFVADVQTVRRDESEYSEAGPRAAESLSVASAERPDPTEKKKGFDRWVITSVTALVFVGLVTAGVMLWRERSSLVGHHKIASIAVLPFKPLVTSNRDESLEMGMADSMITKLSSGDLRVRPLAAVRRYNAVEQDPMVAGRELGVDAVLDGSIQLANDRVRISAKLFRMSDGKQLWAGQYNEASADIFGLQDSISERVASALQIALDEKARKNYTASVEAYQLFSRGKLHASRLILPEVEKGVSYFEQAIAVDPTYAMAYVELANVYRAMVLTNDARPNDVMPKGRAAAKRAVELDGELAEAQNALAFIAFWYDFDPHSAERHHLRALELDPNSSQSHFGYAHLLSNMGRHEEAITEIRRAREIDPVSLVTNALEGQILFYAGRDDEALNVLKATAEMDRNFWLVPLFMSRIFIKKRMWDEAIASAERARDLSRGNSEAVATIGYAQAKAARTAEARKILAELEERAKTRYVPTYGIAAIYDAFGEREKALDMLEKSFAERDALMVFLKVDLKWDGLREEARFVELVKSMNLN